MCCDPQGNIGLLRKLIKRMQENETSFVTEAMRFEKEVDTQVEGCVHATPASCRCTLRLAAACARSQAAHEDTCGLRGV